MRDRGGRAKELCVGGLAVGEMELSTARCRLDTFKVGPVCGTCTLDLLVSKTDMRSGQASDTLARMLNRCQGVAGFALPIWPKFRTLEGPNLLLWGVNPDPGMRPCEVSSEAEILVTLTFQQLAVLGGMDSIVAGGDMQAVLEGRCARCVRWRGTGAGPLNKSMDNVA